jgi:hypothetical protein
MTPKVPLQFNAALPIAITVKKQINPWRYLLQMGTQEISTKSLKKLTIGGEYWAELRSGRAQHMVINHLVEKPEPLHAKVVPYLKPVGLMFDNFLAIVNEPNHFKTIQKILLQQLSELLQKESFLHFSPMLLTLQQDTLTFPLHYGNKSALLQYQVGNQGDIHFFIAMAHLGPMEGVLSQVNHQTHLKLVVEYESSLNMVQSHLQKNALFDTFSIKQRENITPLVPLQERLLNLKG